MRNLSLPSGGSAELVRFDAAPIVQYPGRDYGGLGSASPLAYWGFFRRYKWTVLLWATIGISAGLLLSLLEPRLYRARTTLEVQDLNQDFLNTKQVVAVNEAGVAGAFSDMQTQINIIESNSVLDPVIDRMAARAAQFSFTSESTLERLKRLAGVSRRPRGFTSQDARNLADTMKVRAVGQTRVIEISVESSNPRLAADFLNQLSAEYIDQNMKARWDMSQRTSQSLARLLDDDREKLRTSEHALQAYAKSSGLIITSDKKNVADEKLGELQEELSKAQADRIAAQSRYEIASNSPADGLPDDLSKGLLREYQSQLTKLQQQRAEFAATYTGDYGKIKRLDSEIDAVQKAIQLEERSVVERTGNEYHAAVRREKLLASSFGEQTGVVTDLGQRSVQYSILEHDVESNRQAYDEMLKQMKEASIAAAVEEQNAATQEISRNVQEVSSANGEVSRSIADVSRSAGHTGEMAGEMAGVANALKDDAAGLRDQVAEFLNEMRTA